MGVKPLVVCVDCGKAPAVWLVPARHSFDSDGKPNGSKEAVCANCADARRVLAVGL